MFRAAVETLWHVPELTDLGSNLSVQVRADKHATVFFRGCMDTNSIPKAWQVLAGGLRNRSIQSVHIDASALESCDATGIALVRYISLGKWNPGVAVTVGGLRPELQRLFDSFTPEDYERFRPKPPPTPHMAEEVGNVAAGLLDDLREQVSFVGSVTAALLRALPNPKMMRWGEVKEIFELAGANALPIVSLISLLVGLIIAFQSAEPLAQFGARVYIANMIALTMVRELSPLMTSIMLAGRSGSAFAAEIGTMKVNEELNALQTMGLDPIRFLVVQRVVAGFLLTPILTVYSMLMGVLGCVLVMLALKFPLTLIYSQIASSLGLADIVLGVIKGGVFGVLVASIGCLRGLQTQKGPSAVGQSTTRAVVSGILLIILADAVFSVVTFVLKI